MPFTTNMTGSAELDNSILEEMDAQFLVANAEQGVMDQFVSLRRDIGAKSIEMPKYAQLALATTPLDEDEDVTSQAMSDQQIILTPAEYGSAVTRTKLASLQTGGKADLAAARLVGINMGRTLNKLAVLAAEASSNVSTVDGGLESALTAEDIMTVAYMNKQYNRLARANVPTLAEGTYVACMHDDVIHDLRNSTGSGSWQDVAKYASPESILKNEVGMIAGFRVVRENASTITADAATTVDSYRSLFLGFNGLGKAVSQEGRIVITGPFDKLARFVNVGWHAVLQYKVIDPEACLVGVSASSVGANA